MTDALSMKINLDTTPVLEAIGTKMESQIPFAVSLWINRLANAGQAAERQHMKQRFHLNREDFNLRAIYISKADRATKTTWRAIIQVQARAGYLGKFEEGGEKVAIGGRRYLAIPDETVFPDGIVPRGSELKLRKLNLHKDDHGRLIGDQRTFLAPLRGGDQAAGVFQRVGASSKKGRPLGGGSHHDTSANVRLLYKLVARARVPAKLEFYETVAETVAAKSKDILNDAFAEAMRTAR